MKTFKMLSFDMITKNGTQQIPLKDGIIINQENSHHSWILELYISTDYRSDFHALLQSAELFEARVVISFPENEPAPFSVTVTLIRDIGEGISVLLKGTLKAQRKKYAEQLLKELLEEELSKDELLARFEHGMKIRPKLKGV